MPEFSQVVSGQRFNFPAELYNRLIDSVIGDLTRHQQSQGLPLSSQFTKGESSFVKVFNNSGQDIREFSPIGLGGLEFTPGRTPGDKKETDFLAGLFLFSGALPNESLHNLKFGITQERILNQGVGIVKISGETITRILVAPPGNPSEVKRVGINTGNINYLFETPYGAEVLFIDNTEIENENNAYWALIKMGRLQPISNIPGKAKSAIVAGATGSIVETLADLTEKGMQFDAVNFGPAVSNNDQILWGVDQEGTAFFRSTVGDGEVCDCQNALSFEECWSFTWFQELNDMNSIGGGFDILMKWELTDSAGNLLTSCADIIERANCVDVCDFGWILTQDGGVPQNMVKFPFDGFGADKVDIETPWGAVVFYGFGFNPGRFTIINTDCGDVGVDIFSISPAINSQCPDPTGEGAPCELFDPRQACIDGCI